MAHVDLRGVARPLRHGGSVSAPRPHLGITGVVDAADVAIVRECVALVPPSHRLMAGVLASAKTLRGLPATSRRYPAFELVEALLFVLARAGAWPVVHYNTRATGEEFARELSALGTLLPSMRGLQLNVAEFPPPAALAAFRALRPDVEIVLQYRSESPTSFDLTQHLRPYAGLVDHALVDSSMGSGKTLEPARALEFVTSHCYPTHLGLTLAGGLGPDAEPTLRGVRNAAGWVRMQRLSLDAESGVRVPVDDPTPGEKHQDRLDRDRALAWIDLAARAVGGAP